MEKRDRGVWLLGVNALLSGAVSATVVAIDGRGRIGGAFAGEQTTIYGPSQAALSLVVAVAGVLLLVARRRAAVAALLGVIGLCAAQLAGAGLVGRRRWPHFWGCCAPEAVTENDLVRSLATAMAVVCALTAVLCLVVLVKRGYLGWAGFELRVVLAFMAALTVAIAGPRLVVGGWNDERGLAAWALMYSLPFAAGLAISALMPRLAALAVVAVVAASAVIATVGQSFLELNQPWGDAQVLVVLGALVVGATRLIPWDKRARAEATPPPR